jgi:GR25 family glycosyltransferase involved in LPS biosynthesis
MGLIAWRTRITTFADAFITDEMRRATRYTPVYDNNALIDGIVYINMDSRKDRYEEITAEITKMQLGVPPSHIQALGIARLNKWRRTLILEDDAMIVDSKTNMNNEIGNMLKWLNGRKWDVIMLATTHSDKRSMANSIYCRIHYSSSSSAYIINYDYIPQLVEVFNWANDRMNPAKWTEHGNEVFALDRCWDDLQKNGYWYGWMTDPIAQRPSHSSINEAMYRTITTTTV